MKWLTLNHRTNWDLVKGLATSELYGHAGDVASLSLNPLDENTFVTGSLDQTAKLWDLRVQGACQTFWGHSGDINCVSVRYAIDYSLFSLVDIIKFLSNPNTTYLLNNLVSSIRSGVHHGF